MNYRRTVVNILDSLGANKSFIGYDYVVEGIMEMLKDKECVTCITKSLYIDIARRHNTTWNCVEKNIRTVVNSLWDSRNAELIEHIFKKSIKDKRPTNKEFFKYMYEYILETGDGTEPEERIISVICPISKRYCGSLSSYYEKMLEKIQV